MHSRFEHRRFARRAISSRDLTLLVIAVLLLAIAGLFYACSGDDGASLESSAVPPQAFVCEACGERFELSYDEVVEAIRQIGPSTPREPAKKGFPCPHCGEWAGRRAD
ncbi:MAG: hypothetical protein D6744_07750 [Planctomycetota bacterium]|nr:MAG: hypothetical protein D6744_07750 [Planctomycetota bacterium]